MANAAAGMIAFALGLASLVATSVTADVTPFGYGNVPNGPSNWGNLNPEWKVCNSGKQQSPINIVKAEAKADFAMESLKRDYVDANATLINNGFNVMLKYEEGVGSVLIDGKNYSLQQLHWHSPSEHTIGGERFPVELHMVHRNKEGHIVVLAVLYRFGHVDTFLNQLMDNFKDLTKEKCGDKQETHVPVGVVDNKALKRSTRKYYRYIGSLTTPPCSENVIWNVMGKIREMTPEQANILKAPLSDAYRNNSRPVQPLNGRTVKLFDEVKKKEHSSH